MEKARRGVFDEYRIVLIGKTGAGKSATGNSLLDEENAFVSKATGKSVTQTCTIAKGSYEQKPVVVVDTPGLFDLSKKDIKEEIVNCVQQVLPGPHVFVLVVQIDRITDEEQKAVDTFVKYFGTDIFKFMIVVFTRMDEVTDNAELQQYVAGIHGRLAEILRKIEYKYVAFDNKNKRGSLPGQVERFYEMVRRIVFSNNGMYYSNKMLKDAEKALEMQMIEKKRAMQANKDRENARDEQFYNLGGEDGLQRAVEIEVDRHLRNALIKNVDKRSLFAAIRNLFKK